MDSQVYYYYGRSAYTLRYLIVAAVLFFAAGYNIRVSQHAREHQVVDARRRADFIERNLGRSKKD